MGQGIALLDGGGGLIVEDHVHARQIRGGDILLLAIEADLVRGRIGHLQQQRTRATGRIEDRGLSADPGIPGDIEDRSHDAAHLGGRIELALALPLSVAKWRMRYS